MADNAMKIVADPYRDTLRFVMGTAPAEIMRVEVVLKAALLTATTGTDTYKVPDTHRLAITSIRGHLAMLNQTAEAALAIPFALFTEQGKMITKANNCRIRLLNLDTKTRITDGRLDETISLASILPLAGGAPLNYDSMPHVVLGGQTLRMDATLVDNAVTVLGANTEYGVQLSGYLVRIGGDV
jgi:hypothetical protein